MLIKFCAEILMQSVSRIV